MSGKDRVIAAMSGRKPDVVPVGSFYNCDYQAHLAGIPVQEFVFGDNAARISAYKAQIERHADDLFRCDRRGIPKAWSRVHHIEWEGSRAFVVDERTGRSDGIRDDLTLASSGGRAHAPGASYGFSAVTVDCPVEAIRTKDDLRHIKVNEADSLIESGLLDPLKQLIEELGDTLFITFAGWDGMFDTVMLLGWEEGLTAVYTRPDMFAALLEIEFEQAVEMLRAGASVGAHGVRAWRWETALISPEMYDQYLLPLETEYVAVAHKLGLTAICYLSGSTVWPMLPKILEAGYDALVVESRDKHGNAVDIGEVRKRVGDDLCLFGNIDPIYTLQQGSVQEIEQEVKRQIDIAGCNGAFIVHSDIIPLGVDPAKVDVMIGAARKYGEYPM